MCNYIISDLISLEMKIYILNHIQVYNTINFGKKKTIIIAYIMCQIVVQYNLSHN